MTTTAVPPGTCLAPASHAQKRIFARVIGDEYADNVSRAWRLTGCLNVDALGRALESMAQRHETFRTGLAENEGRVAQVIYDSVPLPLRVVDLAGTQKRNRSRVLTRLALDAGEASFTLSEPPLVRPTLIRFGDRDHVLLLIVGHVIWDAASTAVFERDLLELYAEHAGIRAAHLPAMQIQYADMAAAEAQDQWSDYWQQALAEGSPYAPRQVSRRGRDGERAIAWEQFPALPAAFAVQLVRLGRDEQAPLGIPLLSGFIAALCSMCETHDLTLAIEHANRDLPETRPLISYCVDAVLVVSSLEGEPSFRELLRRTREQVFASLAHRVPVAAQQRHMPVPYAAATDEVPATHEIVLNFISEARIASGVSHEPLGLTVERLHTPKRGYSRDASWPNATLLTTILPGHRGSLTAYAEFDPVVVDRNFVRAFGRRLIGLLKLASLRPERDVAWLANLAGRLRSPTAAAELKPERHWSSH